MTSDRGDNRPDYGPNDPRQASPGRPPWDSGPGWEETSAFAPPPPPPPAPEDMIPWDRSPRRPAPESQGSPGQQRYPGQPGDHPRQQGQSGGYPRQQGQSGDYPRQPGQSGGYPRRQDYPGQQGYRTGGYEGYATSRVYGAPPPPEGGQGGSDGPGRRRRRPGAVGITAIIAVLAVAAAAIVIFVIRGQHKPVVGYVPHGSTPEQDAQEITGLFLTAWQSGQYAKAAGYTDNAAAAQAAMAGFGKQLGLKKLTAAFQKTAAVAWPPGSGGPSATATPTTPREQVTYAATARVSANYASAPVAANWSYHAKLIAYQVPGSTGWYIAWRPDVLAPNLTAAVHLAAVAVGPKVSSVTDNSGKDVSTYHDAGLTHIGQLLAASAPPGQGGTPGLNVELQKANGDPVQGSQAQIIMPGDIPSLGTTIDARAEAAARSAVGMHNNSSMVVLQPSTGHILAVANNAGQNDFALTAQVAPGSTMKVITAAALFNSGALTPSSQVACPATVTIEGITFHNDKNETLPGGTPFLNDFAQSCNNAFTQQYTHLTGDHSLAATAKTYFGLNTKWSIGIPGVTASYFHAPPGSSGSELAQEAFGQGSLVASPIAMASVAATVATGSFHQPILVQSAKQVTATPLPASTDAGLKQVMRAVVTSGTAAGLGFGPSVYAKTGTASIKDQEQPNSWLIAFDSSKDVAVACLVTSAGYGATVAGPEVKAVLDKL